MSLNVRDGHVDVAILAGPRVRTWPSIGVRLLSATLAERGLTVGQWGGHHLRARGVLVAPGPGGMVVAEDAQNRIHRIRARCIVRVTSPSRYGPPFEGHWSRGVLPIDSAEFLLKKVHLTWKPAIAVLGTGNDAFRLGASLLEQGKTEEVVCIESAPDRWGGKRFSGWEVERRRFESFGGKVIEGVPLSLKEKGPMLWELRIQDSIGVRQMEVARVVTAGPFEQEPMWVEYPAGSLLFDLKQTAYEEKSTCVDSYASEEASASIIAGRVLRVLAERRAAPREGSRDPIRETKGGGRAADLHRQFPYTPQYRGKLLDALELERLRAFEGVPKKTLRTTAVASLECFENIQCDVCEKACPESAIHIQRKGAVTEKFLIESKCIGCGICVQACPSDAVVMVREKESSHHAWLSVKGTSVSNPVQGEPLSLVNRRNESLGSCRVSKLPSANNPCVEIEVASHLLWDGRGVRRTKNPAVVDDAMPQGPFGDDAAAPVEKIEVWIDGQKRLCRPGLSVSEMLFELGLQRHTDSLLCPDGACGLCVLEMDGNRRLACQTPVHAGMNVKLQPDSEVPTSLCPCLSVQAEEVVARIQSGHLSSVEAVIKQTGVGQGTCHGMRCLEPLRQIVESQGIEARQFLDWRFPFSDWVVTAG